MKSVIIFGVTWIATGAFMCFICSRKPFSEASAGILKGSIFLFVWMVLARLGMLIAGEKINLFTTYEKAQSRDIFIAVLLAIVCQRFLQSDLLEIFPKWSKQDVSFLGFIFVFVFAWMIVV